MPSKHITIRKRNKEDEVLFEEFETACKENDTDMSREIRRFMKDYIKENTYFYDKRLNTPLDKVTMTDKEPLPSPVEQEIEGVKNTVKEEEKIIETVVEEPKIKSWEDIEKEIRLRKYPHGFELYFYTIVRKALIDKDINGYSDITEEDIEKGYKHWVKNIQR